MVDLANPEFFARRNDPINLQDYCRKLPKVELHAHLNGSISSSTVSKLIKKYENSLAKSDDSSLDSCMVDEWCMAIKKGDRKTLEECLFMFKMIHVLVSDEEAVSLVAHDVVCEFAADGVVYLELRSTPRDSLSTGMTKRTYVDAVLKGIHQAIDECSSPIHIRLLLSIDRGRSIVDAMETVRIAEEYSETCMSPLCKVVGIDFSGDPKAGNVQDFIPVLKSAKRKGFKLSLHLSEIPNVNEETDMLLEVLPDRIGHGTFLVPSVGGTIENIELITSKKIPIELCLTSNLKCKTVPSYDQHQLGFWINSHSTHPVVICTDDKGVFCTSLSDEYYIAAQTFSLSVGDIWSLSLKAVDYIFDDTLKDTLKCLWESHKPFINS